MALKKYDLWASLWNFEVNSNVNSFAINRYKVQKLERNNFSSEFWGKIVSLQDNFERNDVSLLFKLAHLFTTQRNRDFPPYIIKTSESYDGDLDFTKSDKIIKNLFLALRLFQKGNIRGRLIAGTSSGDSYSPQMFFDIDNISNTDDLYVLKDINKFRRFYSNLGKADDVLDSIAIDRFGISYAHDNPIEKLLDLLISLESLFNKSPSDIKFKISIRTSHLIEKSPANINKTYLLINDAYKLRSEIVHGLKINEEKLAKINQFSKDLNDVVRKTLLKAIKLRSSGVIDLFSKVCEQKIDEVIVNK